MPTATDQVHVDAKDEIALVRDLLDHFLIPSLTGDVGSTATAVVKSENRSDAWFVQEVERVKGNDWDPDLVEALLNANGRSWRWPDDLSETCRVVENDWVPKKRPGRVFGSQYLIRVSRPGLNRDGQSALIYFELLDETHCGGQMILLMQKRVDGWHPDRAVYSTTIN